MIVDHAAAAKRADAREEAMEAEKSQTYLADATISAIDVLLKRIEGIEDAEKTQREWDNVTTTGILALIKRVEGIEAQQDTMAMQLVNVACNKQTALDTKALLDSMQHQLDMHEERLAQYAMRLADSDVNLQDCMDRIVAMEKVWQH